MGGGDIIGGGGGGFPPKNIVCGRTKAVAAGQVKIRVQEKNREQRITSSRELKFL